MSIELVATLASTPTAPGNVIFRAGAFAGGTPVPLTPEHGGAIVFQLGDGTEALRFAPDGQVYVRGNLVEKDQLAWTALREWLAHAHLVSHGDHMVTSG
jgi:hypothetical protein